MPLYFKKNTKLRYTYFSHIKSYSKCHKDSKTNKNNGLLLSVLADKLFDKGLISFGDAGNIVFSNKIDSSDLMKVKYH